MSDYYELYQQCKLERDLLREEIPKLQERIKELEKGIDINVLESLDRENEEFQKEIQKRDELLRQAKIEMLSWCDRNRCDLDSIHEWLKQYEELKR